MKHAGLTGLFVVLLAACTVARTPAPTATTEPTSTFTPSPTPAIVPTATATPLGGGTSFLIAAQPKAGQANDMYIMGVDGNGLVNLTNSGANDGAARWLPDGSTIAFNSDRSGSSQIYLMNADGTNPVPLKVPDLEKSVETSMGDWSPDGERIVFASGRNYLYVMNADGTDAIKLTPNPVPNPRGADWSPDGTTISYSAGAAYPNWDIFIVPAAGGPSRNLTRGRTLGNIGPEWSPDGSRIVFSAMKGTRTNTSGVYMMTPEGDDLRLVMGGGRFSAPAWSPDGSLIAAATEIESNWNLLYIVDPQDPKNKIEIQFPRPLFVVNQIEWGP